MRLKWEMKKLSEICEKITDGSHIPPKGISHSQYLMLSSKNVFDDFITFDSPRYLTEKDFKLEDKRTSIRAGDVLMTIVGTIGRVATMPNDHPNITLQRSVAVLKGKKDVIDSRFLMRSLQNIFDEINDKARGVAQKGLYLNQIQEIEIPIPPLPEQQQIVSMLDEAFASIAQAKANAEQNLLNSRELFESVLESFFEDPQHTPNGEPLENLCELIVDCEHKTAPIQQEGYPSIRTPNIGRGYLILDGVNRVSEETYKRWTRRAIPQGGDLIFAREASAGNVAVIPDGLKVCLGQRTVLIRPKNKIFDSQYLMWLLLSDNVQKFFLHNSKGSTVVHVNMKDIRGLKISNIPLLAEQRAIVGRLEALSAETQRLEKIYQSKVDALEELKKSVLQKAFSGEL